MQFPAMKFFLVVALMLVINGPVAQVGAACTYATCIMAGRGGFSGIDNFLVQFKFSQIPADVVDQCKIITARITSCSNTNTGCPAALSKSWAERLTDDRYMVWLMTVGSWACGSGRRDKLNTLRGCATAAIDTTLQACVSGNIDFTVSCANNPFTTSTCNSNTKTFVSNLLTQLAGNPFRTT